MPEFAVPEDIIGEYEAAGGDQIEDQVVVGDIFTLVGIHIDQIIGTFQRGERLACIPDVQGDLVRHPGP